MFKRKLFALDYPCYENFDCKDIKHFRNLVLWLEDQKIRQYKIEDRKALRDTNSPEWDNAYKQYRKDVACPIKSDNPAEVLEWLLAFAVRLEYGDDVEKYKGQTAEKVKKSKVNAPQVVSINPLDNLDFQSPEFKRGVNVLAQLLKVSPHPDHLITLKAVSKIVSQRLSPEALVNSPHQLTAKGTAFPFQEVDLGFDTGDYTLNQAARILHLLYIQNVRDLQTRINETIVTVQTITANPKTDTKLGRVGK